MHSITKICADHLRAFSYQQGVNLKSGHAHELTVAFYGYKSKAAMLSDTLSPIENLTHAQYLVLMPSSFIEDRRKCLEDLPSDLPDIYTLSEEMFAWLISEEKLSFRIFPSWAHLAEALTTEYLKKQRNLILPLNFKSENASLIFNKPLYEFNPKVETTGSEVKLIVSNRYYVSNNISFLGSIDIKIAIKLHRIAGHIGYANAEISLIDCSSQTFSQTGQPFGFSENNIDDHLGFADRL